ncbi:nuclease-related domain-containing protein [Aeromicrobium sp.]|uniref:nuclease-related domain-containing protein n=1 Tax=Aeromicrobium sp. TaxID=1871063 RepID=UPI003516EDE0
MTVHEVERPAYGRHRAETAGGERRVVLRRPGTCSLCSLALPSRATAIADRDRGTLRCVECEGGAALAAAARHRQVELDDTRQDDPPVAPVDLRHRLDQLRDHDVRLLHGRRVPGSSATLDHVVVTSGGVWVVAESDLQGELRVVVEGGRLRPRAERLVVGRRTTTRLVDTVLKQAEAVRDVVGADVPVHPVLCVADDGPSADGVTTRGVAVVRPAELERLLLRSGDAGIDVPGVRQRLAVVFRVV